MGGGAAALNVDFAASAQDWPYICHAYSPGYLPEERRKEKKEGRREGKRKGEGRGGGRAEGEILRALNGGLLSSRLWNHLILAKLQMQISACPQNAVALE